MAKTEHLPKTQAPLRMLTRESVRAEIDGYLQKLKTLAIEPLPTHDPLALFKSLKRQPVKGGPYEGCSVFEVANRVMSDLVVLAATERLLCQPPGELVHLPVREVAILLGKNQRQVFHCDLSLPLLYFNLLAVFLTRILRVL